MFFLSIRHRLPRPASALVHQWNRALSSSSSSTTTKTAKDGSTQRAKDSNQQKKQGTNDPPSISEKEASRLKKISKLKDELRRGYFYELGQVNRTKSKLFEADKELRSIEKAVKVPSFEADSLLGVTHQFESLLQIKRQVSLVGIAFRDFGFQQLPSWIKPFQEEFAGSSSFKIFQVAFEDKTWLKMLKFLMVNGQKSSIERERHGQSFIRFGCTEDIREALDMDNRMVGYALLVDGKGRVRWRGTGQAKEEEISLMLKCAHELAQESGSAGIRRTSDLRRFIRIGVGVEENRVQV